jgi:hypothetical protein
MRPSACQPKADGSPRILNFLGLTGYVVNALNSDMGHVASKLNGCRNYERLQESIVCEGEFTLERYNTFS